MFFCGGDIYSTCDARRLAKKRLPWMVFDYIDGAAGEGYAEQKNRDILKQIRLQPRVLNNVENRRLDVELFGKTSRLPFGASPMGMCNLSVPGADLMLARMAAREKMPLGVSTAASTSLEKMIERAEGNAWFQLYYSGDEEVANQLLRRAGAAGYEILILTVDVPEVGRRPRELRRGFKMPFRLGPGQLYDLAMHPRWSLQTLIHGKPHLANFAGEYAAFDRAASRAGADWSLLDRIRENWKGKLVVKGVLSVADALRLKAAGVDALQVSSHGGRQLDSAPPAITLLQDIRASVGPGYPLFYDSGIRSGEDVVKAYAMGADFVFLGRALLFGMAARGENGLARIQQIFTEEISITLAQLGLTGIDAVTSDSLYRSAALSAVPEN